MQYLLRLFLWTFLYRDYMANQALEDSEDQQYVLFLCNLEAFLY